MNTLKGSWPYVRAWPLVDAWDGLTNHHGTFMGGMRGHNVAKDIETGFYQFGIKAFPSIWELQKCN